MLEPYFVAKLIHILAAVVVTGTGAGIAFFMFMANRSNNPQAIYITTKLVVLGDWLFTTPAVITQIISGLYLMYLFGYSFSSEWFYAVAGLFVLIGLCWLPVLKIQYRLRALAQESVEKNHISGEFKSLMRIWTLLGISAFAAILVIFWLMVFKPLPVV
ncbi:hypothetical protein N474_13005 [Pseudoalteromonas luteoviolacea CPMOR-2]|uniref:DUF2269 family protein n=1 Tax=Pseudoalteromonas luteoviolacea TaxID=43657 RepID=UPI0007B0A3B9|nr:DUF2269 domain-containing protein [Pseudoalteromonas luteoviolacea]KZN56194.1 hypothetical protein N474_13005 [Pseudoalteromonas luteoviolacea CPMOR-2]